MRLYIYVTSASAKRNYFGHRLHQVSPVVHILDDSSHKSKPCEGARIGKRQRATDREEKIDFSDVHFVNMDFCKVDSLQNQREKRVLRKRDSSGGFVLGYLYMACCTRERRVFRSTRRPSDVREVLQADGQIKGLLPNYRLSVKKRPMSSLSAPEQHSPRACLMLV